ncbi:MULTISPECIES: lipoate--protein ligase family protein [Brevibacillus]|uniref:Octanoyltransferase LipM n=1 Tax=Brevibacillus borstelensis AK1 TaxID=1300222 RepID=M8EE51_9BACL|nr:biotin/lipoate A/B protein ligase family protein [Brevibacillus borstelensis]EMT53765.1 lipoate-protein ligase [Brevibacillus borstelensis AK1]MED1882423.1 biotin/lipoate A/B protein ligase family protein [Brevibacillus borstelensis]MED2008839.1 biotin/lipoate A/B protein ligase family protein [Brevibacillus borstelensis]NOU55319.1 lipoate--protein ligase family protein [Brevibacillus borstelensis]RNB62417.1 lipoate--protein ligase family protein [Brevibacillus borstelensis]
MEKWRFIVTEGMSPAMNMAVDEAILQLHSEGKVPPTVRFYTWNPATLSIGYFQKAAKEINLELVQEKGIGFVRRATGGRAVLHDQELTYSVVVSESHPEMPSSVTEAYKVISLGLLHGFQNLGLDAEMVSLASEEEKEKYSSPGSSACFDSPSWYELVVEGKKVAGSAQTRQKGVILQHGSILLDMDVELLFSLLHFSSDRLKERMMESFRKKAVTINEVSNRPVSLQEAMEAFRDGFATGLKVELVKGELTPEERALAEELAASRYSTDEWNLRR